MKKTFKLSESKRTKARIWLKQYRQTHPEYYKHGLEYNKRKFRDLRISLITILGKRCVMCGYDNDIRALNIDHINGGGTKEYRKLGNSQMYRYYLSHPDIAIKQLQTLCCNCNALKRYECNEWMKPYKYENLVI